MRRGFWFVAGAGAGVYVMVKARRAAEALTPEGMRDRLSGLAVGAQLFSEEVRLGMSERETELRQRFGHVLDGPLALAAESATGTSEGHDGLPAAPHALEGTH